MVKVRKRSLVALALLITGVGAVALWWLYSSWAALQGGVVGKYTGSFWGQGPPVLLQFKSDESFVLEEYPPGSTLPGLPIRGRWRMSGRVLILETGAAAHAPVGIARSILEGFDRPLITSERAKVRVVSADKEGLVLDLGGVNWVLKRVE